MIKFVGDPDWVMKVCSHAPETSEEILVVQLDRKSANGAFSSSVALNYLSRYSGSARQVLLVGSCPENDYKKNNPTWSDITKGAIFFDANKGIEALNKILVEM